MKTTICFFLFVTLFCVSDATISLSCGQQENIAFVSAFTDTSNLKQFIANLNQLVLFGENSRGQFVDVYSISSNGQFSYNSERVFATNGFDNIEASSIGFNILNNQTILALENATLSKSPVFLDQIDITQPEISIDNTNFSITFNDPLPEENTYNILGVLNGNTTVGSLVTPNTTASQLDLTESDDGTLSVKGFFMTTEGSGKISAFNGINWVYKTLVWPIIDGAPITSDHVGFYRVHPLTGSSVLNVHLSSVLRQEVLESNLDFSIGVDAANYTHGIEVLLFFDANGNFVENTLVCTDCTISALYFKTRNADTINVVMATGIIYGGAEFNAFYYNYVSLLTPSTTFINSFVILNNAGLAPNSTGFDIDQSAVGCGPDDCDFITGLAGDGTIFVILYNPFSTVPVIQLLYFTENYLPNFSFTNVFLATYMSDASPRGLVVLAISSVNASDATDLQLNVYWNVNPAGNCTSLQWWVIFIIAISGVIFIAFMIWIIVAWCRHLKTQRERNQYFNKHAAPTIF